MAPSPKLEKLLKRGVVRGEIVKVGYFQEQGLEVFLDKLKAHGWFDLFTNTQLGCSQSDVAEFYANVSVSKGVLTSTIHGVLIEVDSRALAVILGVPGKAKLLELAQHLSQQPGLKSPQAVKKGDMQSLHQLIFWFLIKNIIPCAQGCNQADAMDQCLTGLMDRGEQINLPAFVINHIGRIATTLRAHDLGHGFLLTKVFEHFGVALKKKVDAQVIDEIDSSTIMGCGFALIKVGARSEEQGVQTPTVPVPHPTTSQPAASMSASTQQLLQDEITVLKGALQEEKELNAKRHADLLALLTALQPKPPAP